MILLGEHAVVYGSMIAAPISLSVRSIIHPSQQQGVTLAVPQWGVELRFTIQLSTRRFSIH